MGKTLRYGGFVFPKGNRITVRPHTSRARPVKRPAWVDALPLPPAMCEGGAVRGYDAGGLVDPVYWQPGTPFPSSVPTGPIPGANPAPATDPAAARRPDTQVYGALNQHAAAGQGALGGGGAPGAGSQQNVHEINQINAGHAPLTAAGVAAALQNAAAVALGGTAPINAALATGVEAATGDAPGSWGGLQNIPGQKAFTPEEKAYIRAGGTMQGALARTAANQATSFAHSMTDVDAGRHGGGGAGPSGGGGAMGRAAEHGPADTGEHQGGMRSGYAKRGGFVRRGGRVGRSKF